MCTGIPRQTDDADMIGLMPNLGQKRSSFQKESGVHMDITQPDYIFDSINLSDANLRERATRTQDYNGTNIQYLGPEALIATKLTSFCVSNDPEQPSIYGIKVLRDKDLHDLRNLGKLEINEPLLHEILSTVPQLEEVESPIFWKYASTTLKEEKMPISFTKNAFGIGRFLSAINKQSRDIQYNLLKEESEKRQTGNFAIYIDKLFSQYYAF